MVRHTLTYETSTIAHSPGSQTHITTMYQTIFVFLRWTRASTNGNPPTRVGVLSNFLCRAQNHGIFAKSKIRGLQMKNGYISVSVQNPKSIFGILDWEIWPVWISFFSIDFLTSPTRKETLAGQGIPSRVGGLQAPALDALMPSFWRGWKKYTSIDPR